ncbi:MAG: thiamine phosphate synthase [Mariprofundaceae bacterium]
MGHQAILIPRLLLISEIAHRGRDAFLRATRAALVGGVDAVLLREPGLDDGALLAAAAELRALTREHGARLLVHSRLDLLEAVDADGVHLAARDLRLLAEVRRWLDGAPDGRRRSLSASCHDADELARATRGGADFALLSPVFPTASHPGAATLGAKGFLRLARRVPIPVLALGGVTPANRAQLAGFGVATIRGVLDAPDPCDAARAMRDSGA